MSILVKEVRINVHPKNYRNYHGKFPQENGQYILPLTAVKGSSVLVPWICDSCGKKGNTRYSVLLKCREKHSEGKDYCHACAAALQETKEKRDNTYKKNRYKDSEETLEKKRKSHLGKKHSQETIKKIKEGIKKSIPFRKKVVIRLPSDQWVYKKPRSLVDFIQRYGAEVGFDQYRRLILEKTPRRIEYWLLKTDGDLAEAKNLLSKFQSRDINYWNFKYGNLEGEKKYLDWCTKKAINCCRRYSKSSKDFFDLLVVALDLNKDDCLYGPEEYFISLFKEEREIAKQNLFFLDFLYKEKFVIEFNGSYWHRDSQEHDKIKKEILEKRGYKVMYIEEALVIANLTQVLKDVKEFLE